MNQAQYSYLVGIINNPRYQLQLVNYGPYIDSPVTSWEWDNDTAGWNISTAVYADVPLRSLSPEQIRVLKIIDWESQINERRTDREEQADEHQS